MAGTMEDAAAEKPIDVAVNSTWVHFWCKCSSEDREAARADACQSEVNFIAGARAA
jgi:hypothetical protein